MKTQWLKILKSIFSNVDLYITIGVAIYATYLGAVGGKVEYAVAAIALAISIAAFSLFRDRIGRERLNESIISLETTSKKLLDGVTADEFFKTSTSEESYVTNGRKTILMVQETGQLIAERYRDELVCFLSKGGNLKVILVMDSNEVITYMAYRNKQLFTPEMMAKRMRNGLDTFNVLKNEAEEFAKNIEIRFIRYPVDFTAVFSDPDGSIDERKAIIRLQGFKVAFNNKLDFQLKGSSSKKIFDTYLIQAQTMWNLANRCTLLTGPPRIGKTTVLKKLCEKLSKESEFYVSGFITEAILNDSGDRIGFNVNIINDKSSHLIATKTSFGTYQLDSSVMKNIVFPEIEKGIELNEGIFILDEIGVIQIEDMDFRELVMKLFDNSKISIIGTISNDNGEYFSKIRKHLRSGIIEIDINNRNTIPDTIYKEIKQ